MPAKIQRRKPAKPAEAAPARQAAAVGGERRKPIRRVSNRLLVQFTTQLATLSEAGLTVVKSLTILRNQLPSGPFQQVLSSVTEDVAAGTSLSEALSKHPGVFDRLYTNMVRAGEAGGVLEEILRRLADFLERSQSIKDRIKGAMTYPIVVVMVAVLVLSIVFIMVIPKFQEIYDSFEMELPLPTQILIGTSQAFVDFWYLFLGVPVVVAILLMEMYRRAMGFRRFCHSMLLKTPKLGSLMRQTLVARFARTFGTLVGSGVPHLDALAIVGGAVNNVIVAEAVDSIRSSVREGEGISRPMEEHHVFDDMISNMVEVGEETGELDKMLMKVADTYEAEVDRNIEIFFKVLEPTLLVIMAGLVGGIVIALFVPILKIMETLGSQSF